MTKTFVILLQAAALMACGRLDSSGGSKGCASSPSLLLDGTWETGANPAEAYDSGGAAHDAGSGERSGCAASRRGAGHMEHSEEKTSEGGSGGDEVMASDSAERPRESGMSDGSSDADIGSGGSGQGAGARILTAGTFDDGLNFESFKAFWAQPVQPQPYGGDEPGAEQLPAIDAITPATRLAGARPLALDLTLVVDVTGSMGDELEFVKAEIDDISAAVKASFPDVAQRFSLIVYRDDGDSYVTRGIGLTADLAVFKTFLGQQSAGGGGDYPEAMHTALAEAKDRLQWGGDDTAKLLFLIADAPPHGQFVPATIEAVNGLRDKGVHLYPVAASGVADLAERIMRYGALVSGGEYLFLTDDSGVGNPHAAPHVPCYHVRKLNDAMIDVLRTELTQQRLEPDAATILRTVGKPVLGKCEVP